ncbi:hypothetical protein CSB63_0790 [Streptococcus thermophilus]|nr:hypothetical protein Y1U_C0732 [Streptococcus thermophilus MN-ZLW-002]UTS67685.1 hypothetical protein CSB63_0790 [Streptococcus thermophilus]
MTWTVGSLYPLKIDDNTDVGIANLNHYGELYFHNAPL